MEVFNAFFQGIPIWLWWIFGGLLLMSLLWHYRHHVSFELKKIYCLLPFIGLITRLAKDAEKPANALWTRAERVLCSIFYPYLPEWIDYGALWDKATLYLQRSSELGRKPCPLWLGAAIFLILCLEASAFGILLSDFVVQNLPARYKLWAGVAIGCVISVVLLYLTHSAGREQYLNSHIAKIRDEYANRPASETDMGLRPFPDVSLDHPLDSGLPSYIQHLSRLDYRGKVQPRHWATVMALIVVCTVGVTTFKLRESLHHDQTVATQGQTATSPLTEEEALLLSSGSDNSAPAALQVNEATAHWAFLGLAFIFLGAQALGFLCGYHFGFIGKQARDAYQIIKCAQNKEAFETYHRHRDDYVINTAQRLLEKLQQRQRQYANGGGYDNDLDKRTFRRYVQEMRSPEEASSARSSSTVS
jgi:hypothetical protein